MLNKIIKYSMYTSIIFLILWLISFGMLNIAKSLWENNHKKVMVEEKFEKYSSIKWVDKTSPKWETLENIYNILDTVGMPLECISFPIWRISSAVFVSCVIFKYRDEIAEL
ncbi:MAG: hypothetical protein J6A04_03985 [Clostridia bacterium]|nr:hypothetical protein [Clostridia bacterium]MBP3581144.1 hypothetical protein [Clostridia bacterium]MBP3681430.1 hypothetical protein [Clostridia bacterium]